MIKPQRINQSSMIQQLRSALGDPPPTALARSEARVKRWLAQEAPLIRWGEMNSPLGRLFVAVSDRGLCAVDVKETAGALQVEDRAGLALGGEIAVLVDGGFQKFFRTPSGRTRPALAEDLRALHAFEEDLKEVLGLKSLYNESLGTVSTFYQYDRLQGR